MDFLVGLTYKDEIIRFSFMGCNWASNTYHSEFFQNFTFSDSLESAGNNTCLKVVFMVGRIVCCECHK